MTVNEFLEDYKPQWINYCEIIILKNGTIEIATPSHTEKLIKLTGEHRDVIYEKMPIDASPTVWLVAYTQCVAVWADMQIGPVSINRFQLRVLKILADEKMIKLNLRTVIL